MNQFIKITIGLIVVFVLIAAAAIFLRRDADIALAPVEDTAAVESDVEISSDLENLQLEEAEVEAAFDELETRTF